MTNGAFQSTGSPYDVAITGNGWFRVSNTDPTAGDRRRPRHVPGDSTYRVHPRGQLHPQRPGRARHAGRLARRRQGRRHRRPAAPTTDIVIKVPAGATDVSIAADGAVTYTPAGGGARATAGFLSLAAFPNESGLDRVSANRWQATGQLRRRRRSARPASTASARPSAASSR